MPNFSDVQTPDKILSTMAFERKRQTFLAGEIAPLYTVQDQNSTLRVIDGTSELSRKRNILRAPGAVEDQVDFGISNPVSYSCKDHALGMTIPFENMKTPEQALATLESYAGRLAEAVNVNIEIELRDVIVAACTGGTLLTTASAGEAFTSGSSDGIAFLEGKMALMRGYAGVRPNSLMLGRPAFDALRRSSAFEQRAGINVEAVMTETAAASKLAAILGLQKVIVGEAVYNTALPGVDPTFTDIWSDYGLLYYQEPPEPMSQNAFMQPAWVSGDETPEGVGGIADGGFRVEYWFDRERKANRVRVFSYRHVMALHPAGNGRMPAHLIANLVQ